MKKSFLWTVIITAVLMTTVTAYGQMANTPWPKHHKDAQNTGMADPGTPFFINPAVQWQFTVGDGTQWENQSTPLVGSMGSFIYVAGNMQIPPSILGAKSGNLMRLQALCSGVSQVAPDSRLAVS